jgi:hypothetical protein
MNRTSFYNQKDFEADIRMSKEYIADDMGLSIYLYSINIVESKKDIYGESLPNEKEFIGPYKLNVFISIPPSEKTKIGGSMLVNENVETLKLGVYIDELDKLGIDIKRGDYFSYDDNDSKRFYEINTVTNFTTSNQMYNFKAFYNDITATYVKDYRLPENLKNMI